MHLYDLAAFIADSSGGTRAAQAEHMMKNWGWLGLGMGGLLSLAGCSNEGPWAAQSRQVELTCGSFFEGSERFRATRDQLSAEQLALLGNLKIADANTKCEEDGFGCTLRITDDSGGQQSYVVDQDDAFCESHDIPLEYSSVDPFLKTVDCRMSKAPADTVGPDARCFQGLFFTGQPFTEQLQVTDPAHTYHVEIDQCSDPSRAGKVSVQLFDASQNLIGTGTPPSTPGPDGTCLQLDVTVPSAQTISMVVTPSSDFGPGDYSFRFY